MKYQQQFRAQMFVGFRISLDLTCGCAQILASKVDSELQEAGSGKGYQSDICQNLGSTKKGDETQYIGS